MFTIQDALYNDYMKENNIGAYKNLILSLLKEKVLYIVTNNEDRLNVNPMIVPVKDTNWLTIQIFNNENIANQYLKDNELEGVAFIQPIAVDSFLIVLERLFFKGLTGILFNGEFNSLEKTIYIPIYLLFLKEEDTLINPKYEEVIYLLNKSLLEKKFLYYIYHNTMTPDEVLYGIVRFTERFDGKEKFVDIFIDRNIAEKYCEKRKIFINKKYISDKSINKDIDADKTNTDVLNEIESDADKEIYPVTSIMNNVLFNAINCLYNKKDDRRIDYVKIHDYKKDYKVPLEDFLQIVVNVGFPQIDLT